MRVVVELTDREADTLMRDSVGSIPQAQHVIDREREAALGKVRDAILRARVAA